MDLDRRKIVLTGAASGIGLALLQRLAHFESEIFAVDLDRERIKVVLPSAKARIIPYACDVGQRESLDKLFVDAHSEMNGLDLFIANVGFAYYELINAADWEHIERLFRVNVFSPLYSALKMAEMNPEAPYKMVITASTMGHVAIPGYSLYAASKASVHRFAEGYRWELDDPRQLMLVYPIGTRTNFFQTSAERQNPIPKPSQTPDYVADRILKGIQADKLRVYPSVQFGFFSLIDRFFPPLRRWVQGNEYRQLLKWLHQ